MYPVYTNIVEQYRGSSTAAIVDIDGMTTVYVNPNFQSEQTHMKVVAYFENVGPEFFRLCRNNPDPSQLEETVCESIPHST